jgi:hypothetical protein
MFASAGRTLNLVLRNPLCKRKEGGEFGVRKHRSERLSDLSL